MQTDSLVKTRAVLFDFDGTLANTLPAITETARTVLLSHGLAEEDLGDLRRLVGPPFPQAFSMVYGVSPEEAASITDDYRSIYETIGARAWPLYEGVRELLVCLHDVGLILAVVSSKGQHLIERGLADNGLTELFDIVAGNNPAAPESKTQTLERVLSKLEAEHAIAAPECAMVGDRRFDVEAAHACSVRAVAVTWGATCERSELEESQADDIVDSPVALAELLLGSEVLADEKLPAPADLEDYLAENGLLVWRVRGTSMLPLIRQDRDLVELSPLGEDDELSRHDIVLYRSRGALRLHRVLGTCTMPDGRPAYLIRGDNTCDYEMVSREQIIAVMVGLVRGGKRIAAHALPLRLYSHLWQAVSPLTIALHRLYRKTKRARARRKGGLSG